MGQLDLIGIAGLGRALPSRRLTSAELGGLFGVDANWIIQRTGIRERRVLEPGESVAELAIRAASLACEDAGLTPDSLGAIIVATITHDARTPALAAKVHGALGAGDCPAFDISAASTGFLMALSVARGLISVGPTKPILIVAVDALSRVVDWTDRETAILFGDGAGAAVISTGTPSLQILDLEIHSAGSGYDDLGIPIGKRQGGVRMDGRRVFLAAVRYMADAATELLDRHGLGAGDIRRVIAHQAGSRILDGVSRRSGIPRERFSETLSELGNTSSASLPIGLAVAKGEGLLVDGDLVLLTGFGAGYTWGAALIRW